MPALTAKPEPIPIPRGSERQTKSLCASSDRCSGGRRSALRKEHEHGVRRRREAGGLGVCRRARCHARSCVAQSSSVEDRCWHDNGDDKGREERQTNREIGDGEKHHSGIGPLEEMWHPTQLTCDGCGWEVPCCWHAPGARRISSLALCACRQHSLHGWPLVCAFRRGREERQSLYVVYFVLFIDIVIATVERSNVRLAPASLTSTPPGNGAGMEAEEAARQCTAPAMILKSRAHTAARKLRRRGCCGSASSVALHVHT